MDEDAGFPVVVRVTDVIVETPTVSTICFDRSFPFLPGQFVMVWVPGIDEVPMALSASDAITVQRVGEATAALCDKKPGDLLGIRGPFGNGFTPGTACLAVAGGVGAAPLIGLARLGKTAVFLLGARTRAELLYYDELCSLPGFACITDDGSSGRSGRVSDLLLPLMLDRFDSICVCGPEPMMAAILLILEERGLSGRGQFSLHRIMKCGIGVCGSCCIDPSGSRVCREGPIFSGVLLHGSEFGRYHRDGCGARRNT